MPANLADAWQRQIVYCDRNGSPFTARVLEAAWADWNEGGALRDLLPDWPGDAWLDAVPLRVAGALHSLALDASSAELAALYPPASEHRGLDAAVKAALNRHRTRIANYLQSAPQTNEIGRSAVLLGGFAAIARDTGLPLATLEIGASAGLNQLWHRYRYELGGGLQWGDAASPVLIRSDWRGALPALPPHIDVRSFAACDRAPIDLAEPAAALRLASYVWADQTERRERLSAAIALAQSLSVAVERADAADWLERRLALPNAGVATVVVHSIVWQYLPLATRERAQACIEAAGTRATREAPLAWLAFEVDDAQAAPTLSLTQWPGGTRRVLAQAHAHGQFVDWF